MRRNFLEEDKFPTFEEIKENFMDFTKDPFPLSNSELNDENFPLYKRAKYLLNSYLWQNLRELNRTAPENCFTKDEPVEVLLNFIREYVARAIVKLYEMGIAEKIIEDFNKTRNPELSDDDYVYRAVKILFDVMDMKEIINVTKEIPDALDFSKTKSINYPKNKFYEKWNAKLDVVLTEDSEKYKEQAEKYNADLIEVPDETIVYNDNMSRFLENLSEQDKQILFLRLSGKSYEDIGNQIGYKDHTGVLKRMKKIGELFEKETKIDLGFSENEAKSSYNKNID